ncbi:MAG: cardiolipin synthetase [Elusimicrobia bacterium]|nr:MAG: cardiolipin synthetase [Elusimicrobiota bacterium]
MRAFPLLLSALLLTPPAGAAGVDALVAPLTKAHPGHTGLFVLDRGEDSLLARLWMIERASKTVDAQYFIWTADNVGILASEALLRAAERGVRVRVIVDDLMVDAPTEQLSFLAAHPNVDIKVYNPNLNLGQNRVTKLWNTFKGLRSVNQRMHDKTFVVDGAAAVTGGRNVADEYFDYDHAYNFRDRDVLVLGPAAREMAVSFQRFWGHPLSVPLEQVRGFGTPPAPARAAALRGELRAYAADPANFAPEVRAAAENLPRRFPELFKGLAWADARFVCDLPGKNAGDQGLEGGGETTRTILEAVNSAKSRVVIQSPYCVLTEKALAALKALVAKGVSVRIVTNSLAASDNLMASSGYLKQRRRLLDAGIEVFEFRPDAEVWRALMAKSRPAGAPTPVFAVHAKTLVVDGETVFIGTFNLDPRSAHLNTEAGVLAKHAGLASAVEASILTDMAPGNAWKAGTSDHLAPWGHRLRAFLWGLLPITPLL